MRFLLHARLDRRAAERIATSSRPAFAGSRRKVASGIVQSYLDTKELRIGRMRRTSFEGAECPVARSLDVIGDWWSLLIVRDAFDGVRRFGAFQKSLGIAKGMLSTRLQALMDAGVLELAPAADGTAYQEYVLTRKGRDLFPVVVALRQWGEQHLYRRGERRSSLVDTENGAPVARLELRSADGRALGWSDTSVKKPSR